MTWEQCDMILIKIKINIVQYSKTIFKNIIDIMMNILEKH